MKKYYIPLMLMLLVLPLIYIGCRDRIERDITGEGYTVLAYPLHCYNGTMDSGEVDIDCGGGCKACVQVGPPCTVSSDSCFMSSPTMGNYKWRLNSITTVPSFSPYQYEFHAATNNTAYPSIEVDVYGQTPTTTSSYNVTQYWSNLDPGYAAVRVWNHNNLEWMACNGGSVYLTQTGGKYTVTVCSATMTYLGNNYTISTKIVQP